MNTAFRILTLSCVTLLVVAPALADDSRAGKILTSDIAAKALGGPVKAGSQNGMPDTEVGKTWVSKARYSLISGGKSCSILIRHAASKDESKNIFHDSKDKFSGVTVSGFGDEAYRVASPTPQFNVLKGSNWLIVSAGTMKEADNAAQESVARAVLPAIPSD